MTADDEVDVAGFSSAESAVLMFEARMSLIKNEGFFILAALPATTGEGRTKGAGSVA